MKNKGYILTMDAVIALIFVIGVFILIVGFEFFNPEETGKTAFLNLHYVSEDAMDVLNKKGVLDDIGYYSTMGNTNEAENITKYYLDLIIPKNVGYALYFDDETIYESLDRLGKDDAIVKTHSARILSGYMYGMFPEGCVARAYLTSLESKTDSAFTYFGGFIGQGDITKIMELPDDAQPFGAYIEVDAGSGFDLNINGNSCGGHFSAGMVSRDISACSGSFTGGNNTIEITFSGENREAYFGGGYIRVDYNTSKMDTTGYQTSGTSVTERYYFDGIDGIINIYDALNVPGVINSAKLHLDYDNNYYTFLNIGGKYVFIKNATGGRIQNDTDISPDLSGMGGTIPLRLGTSNTTYETVVNLTGLADVVLITDRSGSMNWRFDNDDTGTVRSCTSPQLYDPSTKRISLVKCLDKDFIDNILNISGNRIGLVSFTTSASKDHDLSSDTSSLKNKIDGYSDYPGGGTCICCAINRAYSILNSQSNDSRQKFIIVMSDGVTGYHCGGCGSRPGCSGSCTSTSGSYDCGGGFADCTGPQCDNAINDAICSSKRAHETITNTMVYSVGFGPVINCPNGNLTLQEIANYGGGTYQGSANTTELKNIYDDIAQAITKGSGKYLNQTLVVEGSISTDNTLFPGSYIEYTYTSSRPPLSYAEISITTQTEQCGAGICCFSDFKGGESVRILDARVTSYSGQLWTDQFSVDSPNIGGDWDLSAYGMNYTHLGDPYTIQINPPTLIDLDATNCITLVPGSSHSRIIYTFAMKYFVPYDKPRGKCVGASKTIWYDSNGDGTGDISKTIIWGNASDPFDPKNDSIDYAVWTLLDDLNFVGDSVDGWNENHSYEEIISDGNRTNPVDISIGYIDFDAVHASNIKSMWGPAVFRLDVWM